MLKSVLDLFAPEVIKNIGDAIDQVTTSDEERGRIKLDFMRENLKTIQEHNKIELAKLEAKKEIILAEANNNSWLARTWRPIVMLMFALTAVAHAFGLTEIDEEYVGHFYTLLTIGLGGHVIGRSGEKIVKTLKDNKQEPIK